MSKKHMQIKVFSSNAPVYRKELKLYVLCPHCGKEYVLNDKEARHINLEAF